MSHIIWSCFFGLFFFAAVTRKPPVLTNYEPGRKFGGRCVCVFVCFCLVHRKLFVYQGPLQTLNNHGILPTLVTYLMCSIYLTTPSQPLFQLLINCIFPIIFALFPFYFVIC